MGINEALLICYINLLQKFSACFFFRFVLFAIFSASIFECHLKLRTLHFDTHHFPHFNSLNILNFC